MGDTYVSAPIVDYDHSPHTDEQTHQNTTRSPPHDRPRPTVRDPSVYETVVTTTSLFNPPTPHECDRRHRTVPRVRVRTTTFSLPFQVNVRVYDRFVAAPTGIHLRTSVSQSLSGVKTLPRPPDNVLIP